MTTKLILGDSWSLDWHKYANIPDRFARGIGGSTAKHWAEDQQGILTNALSVRSEVVIICLGGNDVMGSFKNWRQLLTIERDLNTVVARCSGRRVYLVQYTDPLNQWVTRAAVQISNTIIQRVAQRRNCGIIPTWHFLQWPGDFIPLDIHMNESGKRKMGHYVRGNVG